MIWRGLIAFMWLTGMFLLVVATLVAIAIKDGVIAQIGPQDTPNPYGWNILPDEDVTRELPPRRTVFDRCEVVGALARHHRQSPKARMASAVTTDRSILAACFGAGQ